MTAGVVLALVAALGSGGQPMGEADARHLLARSGFGGSAAQVERFAAMPYAEGVRTLLDGVRKKAVTPPPEWIATPPPRPSRKMSAEERKKAQAELRKRRLELKEWWYREMVATDSPLTEHMVLFWHNHFTSSLKKVRFPALLFRQNALFRKYALGNFRELVHAVAHDPAMVLYLDNQTNNKGKPNENFARELMELFTLGEGHYTEHDIKQSARAFTGWKVDRRTGDFRFVARQHDTGTKTFMGHEGDFGGDDIIDFILARPEVAEFITTKLWREFISDSPDPDEVHRLAAIFRKNNYEIAPLLQAIFMSPAFRSPVNRGCLVKSPVELMVGTVRTLDLPIKDGALLARLGRQMGQDLFDPPNVKGWPGGLEWIDSTTLLVRQALLERIVAAARGAKGGRKMRSRRAATSNLEQWYHSLADSPAARLHCATALLLPIPPVDPPQPDTDPARILRELLLDPAYQLK